MKRGTPETITLDDGTVIGVYFGYSYRAEQEWGIEAILQTFGVLLDDQQPEVWGIERYLTTKVPKHLTLETWSDGSTVLCWHIDPGFSEKRFKSEAKLPYKGHQPKLTKQGTPYKNGATEAVYGTLATCWSGKGFLIRGKDEDAELVKNMHQWLTELDATISLGGPDSSNPFGRAAINICKASAIPEDDRESMQKMHEEAYKTEQWVKSSRIREDLEAAGIKYAALRAKNFPEGLKDQNGDYTVKPGMAFWLNPLEYDSKIKCKYGWFSLEDLRLATKGKGPAVIR